MPINNKQQKMKHPKLLVTLLVLTFLLSAASFVISLHLLVREEAQDDVIETMQVVVLNPKIDEESTPADENIMLAELHDPQAALAQAESAQAEPAAAEALASTEQTEKAEESKAAKQPAKKPAKTEKPAEQSLHGHLIQIIAGEEYVDLGLPSGTLWKAENEEGLMDFNSACKAYKKRIPSMKQWGELERCCKWEWTGDGYSVTGPNGATIFVPAAGYRNASGQIGKKGVFGNYWTSTKKGREEAWRFGFEEGDKFSLAIHSRKYGRSIRLVYTPILPTDNKNE